MSDNKEKTYKDIFSLHIKYLEYLVEKSLFSHRYTKNINFSGSYVEHEVRKFFSDILPQRFKVTHGYVVYAKSESETPSISPQIDMIIVDTLVPHVVMRVDERDGMEIVPKECVVGIFEIKRTLNKKSLFGTKKEKGVLEHLKLIAEILGVVTKTDGRKFLPGGIELNKRLGGGNYSNPILGIIGLTHNLNSKNFDFGKDALRYKSENKWVIWNGLNFDILASMSGFIYVKSEKINQMYLN